MREVLISLTGENPPRPRPDTFRRRSRMLQRRRVLDKAESPDLDTNRSARRTLGLGALQSDVSRDELAFMRNVHVREGARRDAGLLGVEA